MKKILAVLLAAMIVLSLGVSALAEDPTPSAAGSFTFTKTYIVNDDTDVFPGETLGFTVTKDAANPDDTMITVNNDDNEYDATGVENTITVNYPAYTKAGVYRYTIVENEGNTQGVKYNTGDTKSIAVVILVTYVQVDGKPTNALEVADGNYGVEIAEGEEEKADEIENTYDLGGDENGDESLKVTKQIEGNLASPDVAFDMTLTLTAEEGKVVRSTITYEGAAEGTIAPDDWQDGVATLQLSLKADETVTFNKVPVGITYHVEEDEKYAEEGLNDIEKGYTITNPEDGTITKGEKPTAIVLNEKDTTVKTGIILQYAPYIAILAVVLAGIALMIIRRRRNDD